MRVDEYLLDLKNIAMMILFTEPLRICQVYGCINYFYCLFHMIVTSMLVLVCLSYSKEKWVMFPSSCFSGKVLVA